MHSYNKDVKLKQRPRHVEMIHWPYEKFTFDLGGKTSVTVARYFPIFSKFNTSLTLS